jgi:integrase
MSESTITRRESRRYHFTEASLRGRERPLVRETDYDDEVRGLHLRVTPAGAKTFGVFRRVRGASNPARVTIGRWPTVSVKQARAKAQQLLAAIAQAENPAEARRALREELTLGELFERYIADREASGKRSTVDIRANFERYLGEMPDEPVKKHGRKRVKPEGSVDWSRRKLSDIPDDDVKALHSRIVAAGHASTANHVHELLRAMYRFAVRSKLCTSDPTTSVNRARIAPRSSRLRSDQIPAFLAALDAEPQPWRDYFTVLLFLGYRRAAVAAMAWSDVDLRAGTWQVPGERAKNGEPIVLPLVGEALTALKRRARERESEQWVFPGAGRDGHITQPKGAFKRVLERAGVERLKVHDLRHTVGSLLAEQGVPQLTIARVLGHKDARSALRYVKLETQVAADALRSAHAALTRARGKRAR